MSWLTIGVARLNQDCLWEFSDESRGYWTDSRLPVGGLWEVLGDSEGGWTDSRQPVGGHG